MSAVGDALRALAAATDADDWARCDAWAAAHREDAALRIAAGCVAQAMERDRHRRAASIEEDTGDGLIEPQRRMFRGIVRLWEVAAGGGPVRELAADADATYALLVEGPRPIALAVSCRREAIVATEVSPAATAAERAELAAVLGALAYVASDGARIGRAFGLVPGTVNHVELLGGTAPELPSRWAVARGGELAPWLDAPEVVAVSPAGGRIRLAPQVVQLEQAAERLFTRARLAVDGLLPAGVPWPSESDLRTITRKLELLDEWGWTAELEPLRPRTTELVARVRAGATLDELRAWLLASVAP